MVMMFLYLLYFFNNSQVLFVSMYDDYHYYPDIVSLAVGNVLQNNNLHLKQALSDLNAESLYDLLLKRGYNEF